MLLPAAFQIALLYRGGGEETDSGHLSEVSQTTAPRRSLVQINHPAGEAVAVCWVCLPWCVSIPTMSHSIVSAAHLRMMFDRFNGLDDLTILEMSVSYGYQDHEAFAIVRAYRALLSKVPTVPPTHNQPVRCLGIVGASSVPTSIWPYLLLAHCFNTPVKIKLPASDVSSVYLLKDIITRVTESTDTFLNHCFESSWDISIQAGDVLLGAGFWDDCDSLHIQ